MPQFPTCTECQQEQYKRLYHRKYNPDSYVTTNYVICPSCEKIVWICPNCNHDEELHNEIYTEKARYCEICEQECNKGD